MKTKIGMSFGIALMLAVGVFATMLALEMFTTISPVQADVSGPGPGGIPTITVSPDAAGALARHTIIFETPNDLVAGSDTITIQFEDDVGVPTILDPLTITIIATDGTNRPPGFTGDLVANPISATTELVGVPADETNVTLLIPDMGVGEVGTQGIAGGIGTVTVIFNLAAGLTNPTEGTKDYRVKVKTSKDTTFVNSTTYNIPRDLILEDDDGNRGSTVTAMGRGFQNGTTATVWLDTDKDGVRDLTETILGSALVGSDDTFEVSFIIAVPPFVIGSTPNQIRAIDGQNNTDDGKIATYLIEGLLSVTPKEAAIGDTVTANILDWPADEDPTAISNFTLAGVNIFSTLAALQAAVSISAGEDTFTFDVPAGVLLGLQQLRFRTPSETDTTVMNILSGVDLSLSKGDSPDPVLPGATLTYTLKVTNGGASEAQNVVVVDTLPPGVTFVSTSGCGEDPGGVPTCSLGTLVSGGSATYTITVDVDPGASGVITNQATAASDTVDLNPADNAAAETTVIAACTLELTPSYAAGTLTVDALLGTNVAVTANLWETSQSDIISLFSGPVAVTEPPINAAITKPLPPSGTVGLLATLTTAELGIICSDFKTVDTGSPP